MSRIVNLRQARKAKARDGAEIEASRNRVMFGRSRAERETAESEIRLLDQRLDGHRRLKSSPDDA